MRKLIATRHYGCRHSGGPQSQHDNGAIDISARFAILRQLFALPTALMSAKTYSGRWGLMTDTTDEEPIARALRRARELGEECLALAKLEVERLTQNLGRTPSFAERVLLEHVAYLTVRIRALRSWGRHREADDATRLLATLLKNFEKNLGRRWLNSLRMKSNKGVLAGSRFTIRLNRASARDQDRPGPSRAGRPVARRCAADR
jgi:hypothetical protein